MAKPITLDHLPEDLARFAEAEVAAGHFASVEAVVEAGLESLRENVRREQLADLRRSATEGFAAFDRGEGIDATPDALMDGIEGELGLRT